MCYFLFSFSDGIISIRYKYGNLDRDELMTSIKILTAEKRRLLCLDIDFARLGIQTPMFGIAHIENL